MAGQNQLFQTDGVIFDIDGTLWDSRETVAKAWNRVIVREYPERQELDMEVLTGLFGKPMDEIAAAVFPELTGKERDRMAELCFMYENELLESEPGSVYPDVKETLSALAEKVPLFIVSNCQKGYIEVCMKGCGIEPYIRDYLCYGDTLAPKSETLKQLVERNALKHPVYVGDTEGDRQACLQAGVPMIYAAYGLGEVVDAPAVIHAMRELPKLLILSDGDKKAALSEDE